MSKVLPSQTANRVIIKQFPAEQKVGNLIIPETVGEKPLIGTVVATSEYYNCAKNGRVEPIVKVGDNVLFEKHTFIDIEYEGTDHVMINEFNIIMVL
jgi:co-chaperonin GroES (HSP10)